MFYACAGVRSWTILYIFFCTKQQSAQSNLSLSVDHGLRNYSQDVRAYNNALGGAGGDMGGEPPLGHNKPFSQGSFTQGPQWPRHLISSGTESIISEI